MSRVISQRGEIDMIIADGVDETDFDALCVLHNTITGTKSKPIRIQVALKWGYWEPPKTKLKVVSSKGVEHATV